jgi:pimeloyl-ACP methyl ester carboxylesterase
LKNVVLVGWSQGVQDVAAYVEQFGTDSIAGFVLVDSPLSSGPAEIKLHPESSERLFELMAVYSAHPKEYYAGLVKSIIKHEISPEQLHQLTTNSEKMSTTSGLAMLVTDLFTVDRRAVLKKLSKPTLIIASAESKELESQREMQRSIPNAQLEVVSEAGHAVFIDQPKKFKPDENGRPKNPGAINGGFYKKSADMPAQYPSVVIGVGDIKEAMKKVTEAGGKVLGEPMEIPGYGIYVSFFDTEGTA